MIERPSVLIYEARIVRYSSILLRFPSRWSRAKSIPMCRKLMYTVGLGGASRLLTGGSPRPKGR